MRRVLSLVLAIAVGALAAGCDLVDGDNSDGGTTPTADSGPPPSGELITKNAGESAEVEVTSDSQYMVVPYSVSAAAADAIDFEITLTGGTKTTSYTGQLNKPLRVPLKVRNPALWARWQERLAVERWTRRQAERAFSMKNVEPGGMTQHAAGDACTLSSGCKAGEVCAAGTCATSVTLQVKEFAKVDTITALVKKVGKVAAILVDKDDTVADATLTTILKTFEETIYVRDVALFGNPVLKSGDTVLASDRNGDGLVWLVLTKRTSDKKSAVGFFNAMDFTTGATSNKADILYIDSSETKKLAAVNPIMAHEFQHLLSYGSKVYKPKIAGGTGALEALWLDEGQAHFAEDACGFGGENVNLLSEKAFPDFGDAAIIYSPSDDELTQRTMAYMFVQYLFEQKGGVTYAAGGGITDGGGAAFLKKLHTTSKTGTAAVDEAFGKSYKSAFDTWVAAVALDGRGVTSFKAHKYNDLVDDLVTGSKIGLKVRGTRKDSDGQSVKLDGPNSEDLTGDSSESLANSSAKFFVIKKMTGKVTIKVTSKATDFRFAVIKIK